MSSLSKMLFGEIALRKGLVNQQQIDECLEIQKKLKEMGITKTLGAVMHDKKYLSMVEIKEILREMTGTKDWNAIEGYHFPNSGPRHKELCDIIDLAGTKLRVGENWFAIISPPGENRTGVYPWPAEGESDRTGYFITLYLWPDWIIYYWPHMRMISTFLMRPTGPETCVVCHKGQGAEHQLIYNDYIDPE